MNARCSTSRGGLNGINRFARVPCQVRLEPSGGSGGHFPATAMASCGPGHGGIVIPMAVRDAPGSARNWKCVPTGMLTLIPASNETTSSVLPERRHISPWPERTNQISSTVRWHIGSEARPAESSKCAMLPRAVRRSTRTSEPSGATRSGNAGNRFVSCSISVLCNLSCRLTTTPARFAEPISNNDVN